MTIEKLQQVHKAQPFKPFRMNLADGRHLDVQHPEIIAYVPTGRTVLFVHADEREERVDMLLVVSLETLPSKGNGRGRWRKAG